MYLCFNYSFNRFRCFGYGPGDEWFPFTNNCFPIPQTRDDLDDAEGIREVLSSHHISDLRFQSIKLKFLSRLTTILPDYPVKLSQRRNAKTVEDLAVFMSRNEIITIIALQNNNSVLQGKRPAH